MNEKTEQELQEIIAALADISAGNLMRRLPEREPTTMLGALSAGVNSVVNAWSQAELKARQAKKELASKLATIEVQAAAIRELSTPILEVWDATLLLPIVGYLDSRRRQELMTALLEEIVRKNATSVILDITGVEVVDTHTADLIVRLVRATKLLGAKCLLTGLSPAVAQTLVGSGSGLEEVTTIPTLRDGVRRALQEGLPAVRLLDDPRRRQKNVH